MSFTTDLFDALPHQPATYAGPAGSFDLRIAITESDRAFRTSRRDQVIGSDASCVVLDDRRVRTGGVIATGGARYRVDAFFPSSVPGLTDLRLVRISGTAAPVFDATGIVPLDQEITIRSHGRSVW
ncbi:hypothetical protein DWF04_015410 [Cereibacter sphaeroides f. sp. denitrificans]